jgi:large subunit ribosomal protein L25
MEQQVFKATRREALGTANSRRLRADGKVPVIIYGHGQDVLSLTLDVDDAHTIVEQGQHLVTLDVDGVTESALIKDVQWDTWSLHVLHVDFTRVDLTEAVTVTVEIHTHGTPKEVSAGAMLDIALRGLEVSCTADRIPGEIKLEVGEMLVGESIHVRDIELPEGVTAVTGADALVLQLREPRAEEEDETTEEGAEGVDSAEPEVINKGKAEEDEAGEG